MRKNGVSAAVVLFFCLFPILANAAPPIPARIGGTITVDGVQLTQATDKGYTVVVTRANGTPFTPSAEDLDGLNASDWYLIDIPIYEQNDQPGGANPGDAAVVHLYKNGAEIASTTITVGDSGSTARVDLSAVTVVNQAPTADAGANQTVVEGSQVTLNGSGSSDPDDGIATYQWTQSSGPNVTLNNANSDTATFTAPAIGSGSQTLTFQLEVTDNSGETDTDTCTVVVNPQDPGNVKPDADAGPNQTVMSGDPVTLDGSGSSDPDDGIAAYQWTQLSGPAVTLNDSNLVKPMFTAPDVGGGIASLTFQLKVTDNAGEFDTDTCVVSVSSENVDNTGPTADAGGNRSVVAGSLVALDGSNSSDPDDGIAGYLWQQLAGKEVTLSNPTAVNPTFVAPDVRGVGETITFQLSVFDNGGLTDVDTCTFTIIASDDYRSHLYFSHIASTQIWETEICIININAEQDVDGELKAYDKSGRELSATNISLPPNARREIIVGDELPNPSEIGYLVFDPDSKNVCGYTKFYTEGKYRVAVPAEFDVNSGDIYIPHIASGPEWWTGVGLTNTFSVSKELSIEFDNGAVKTITLAPKEHKVFTIASLFDGVKQPNIRSAVIKNGSGIIGMELFGSSDETGNSYLSGILLKDETTTDIDYPHVVSSDIWWTGIVAYNPSDVSANLTITPFKSDGTALSTQMLRIDAKEKYIGTASQLSFPDGTAWFQIEGSSPITGFELFGTTNGKQLGGYTGVGIRNTDGVFAKMENDGWTGVAFVNVGSETANITLTAYDDSGVEVASETLNLLPHEKVLGLAEDLFYEEIGAATYLRYSSDREIVGFQLNGSNDGMLLDGLPGM